MFTKVYQSGLKFMLCDAIKKLYNGEVIFHHSLDKGIYATIVTDKLIDHNEIKRIKEYMDILVTKDIPFNKKVINKSDALKFYKKNNLIEKAYNVLNISNTEISLYEFDGLYNYFYSHEMPKSSKEINLFDLYYIKENEIVLLYPENGKIDFHFRNKIYESFHEYDNWLHLMQIDYVSDVNTIVANGKVTDLIRKNDIKVDNDLYRIAKDIKERQKRIVLIAGPSSSGKTTTSKKLSLYLSSIGIKALPISLDDFFLNRVDTPLDSEGNYDFESLDALDLKLFNNTLKDLLAGQDVKLPRYDFILGVKEFSDKTYKLEDNECLIIEGLHSLNPNLIELNDLSLCYKIYISPLTPLNVDRHNYVSTTDNRLLRRIVRDFKTRGKSAETSLATWASVRAGEEKYIFPYTDTADAILNTAYVYEIGVLKVYVEPLLYSIDINSEYYYEARRLIESLKTFYAIPSEYVNGDNLLREFIGGSNFEER